MPVSLSVKKSVALVLVAGAAAGAVEITTQTGGAAAGDATALTQGNPKAVPPILRPARPAEAAAIRASEAREGQEFHYSSPATAHYSNAELTAYARGRK